MFRIFESIRYGRENIDTGYAGENLPRHENQEVNPLDPIDPKTVGRFRVKSAITFVRRAGYVALATILETIVGGCTPPWVADIRETREGPVVGARYRKHLDELTRVGLLAEGRGVFTSSYFAVPKGKDSSRSIFNGKRLSRMCPRPPPVNLLNESAFLERLRQHLVNHERGYVIEGDLRHWFHQIPVSAEVQRIFGLRSEEKRYLWQSLPMGWSWSPTIAQGFAWSFLLFTRPGEKAIFDSSGVVNSDQLPYWLPAMDASGKEVGFAVVYYDNFFIIVNDENAMRKIEKRIRANLAELNIEVKGNIHCHHDQQVRERGVEYLGMSITWNDQEVLVRPSRLAEWKKEQMTERPTCREVASLLGRALFNAMIRDECLRATTSGRRIVALARAIAEEVKRGGWDALSGLRGEMARVWKETLAVEDRPHTWSRKKLDSSPVSTYVVATDASGWGWGVIVWLKEGDDMRLVFSDKGRWSQEVAKWHIFLLELDVAVRGVLIADSLAGGKPLIVVCDNVAVSWAMRQGYTRNRRGQTMLERLDATVSPRKVVTVISQDNPADEPSRNKDIVESRVHAMMKAIDAVRKGHTYATIPPTRWSLEERRRMVVHEAPSDSEEDLCPEEL